MKIAVIGASGHGVFALQGMKVRDGCSLVGVAPGSDGEAMAPMDGFLRQEGFECPRFEDARRMLDECQPDVVVVHPHFCDHVSWAIEAMQRGLHVFVEKPVALDLEGVARLREAHASSGVQLAGMLNMRYEDGFRAAHDALADGLVGDVRVVHAQKSYRLGQRPEFFKARASFGGLLPWIGSHGFDMIAFASRKRFVRVFASHSTAHNGGHGELEVSAACVVELEGGATATVNLDYFRPASAPSHGDDRMRVVGSEGVLEVRDGRCFLLDGLGPRELPPPAQRLLFADFIDQIRGEGACLVGAEESFSNTEISILARDSADRGRVLEMPAR